jgi:hypothetical protein
MFKTRRIIMNVKVIFFTVIVVLLNMTMVACEPSDKNENDLIVIPPPLDEWWKQIEDGGEIYADFRYIIEDGGIKILRYEGAGGTITIPSEIKGISVTTIGIHAFRETKLENVFIPDSVISIGDNAFRKNMLTNVDIPNSVKIIGNAAFDTNQLNSIVIPNSVISVGISAFGFNRLFEIVIPDSITSIEAGLFQRNRLLKVIIPDHITYIGEGAFASNFLSDITISENVTRIAPSAFFSNGLTRVVIPNNVSIIEWFSFRGNGSLVEITIGENVSIDPDAFNIVRIGGFIEACGFVETYNNIGRLAGTYTRPDANSIVWTMQ